MFLNDIFKEKKIFIRKNQSKIYICFLLKTVFMKKLFTLCILCVVSYLSAQQCTPNQAYKDSTGGVYPKPSEGISKKACIDKEFEYVFTIVVPSSIDYNGFIIDLNSVSMDSTGAVDSLPVGINYYCNPPNCFFPKNTMGCIALKGTATSANQAPKNYNLKIRAKAATLIGELPIEFPGALFPGNYYLRLLPNGSDSCNISGVEDIDRLTQHFSIKPNPASDNITIQFDSQESGNATIQILGMDGHLVNQLSISVQEGQNAIDMTTSSLKNGLYMLLLRKNNSISVEKLSILK